jgi:hypothetical protein
MEKYKGLPLIEFTIDGEGFEVDAVAIVDAPAIKKNFQTFNEQKKENHFFAIQDEEKRIISGALMLADTPIYRNDDIRGEYYCKFSKDTIEKIAVKFFDKGFQKNVNFMHDGEIVDGFVMFESFISDKSRGVLPMQGYEDCPDGSWFCSFKVENEKAWQLIKEGKFKGFSVEGAFSVNEDDMFWSEFIDVLKMALQ